MASLWDMVARVMGRLQEWRQTAWDAVDVDLLVEETKKLLKEMKALSKAIRSYPVYKFASHLSLIEEGLGFSFIRLGSNFITL